MAGRARLVRPGDPMARLFKLPGRAMSKSVEPQKKSISEGARLRPPTGFVWAFYLGLLAIAFVPIFMVDVLPLGDMPNHLARAYILNSLDTDANLRAFYVADWRLFSFQSIDFILPPLTKLFGLSAGVRIFTVTIFLLLVGGTAAVHRALFGRVGIWPAFVLLFLYGLPLAYGQISFLFTTGLGLLLFATWIATVRYRHPVRLAGFALGTFALLLCHFFAFASYALTVMTYEAYRTREEPDLRRKFLRLAEAGVPFVIPALCFGLAFGDSIHGETVYGISWNNFNADFSFKVITALGATFTYFSRADLITTVSVALALWFIDRRRLFCFAPGMRLTAIVLLLTAFAMPNWLFGVSGADLRIPYLLALLLVASSDIEWRSRRQIAGFAIGVTALMLLRVVTITEQWQKFDADFREFRTAAAQLERASRLVVFPNQGDFREQPQPLLPYNYVGTLAIIDRQVFDPTVYTFATSLDFTPEAGAIQSDQMARKREIRWRPSAGAFAAASPDTIRQVEAIGQRISAWDVPTSTIDWSDWPEEFDYAVDLHFSRYDNPVPELLTEIWRGSYFSIYRIHPPR